MILQILARCGAFFIGFIVKGQMNHDFAFGIEVNPCVIEITIGKALTYTAVNKKIDRFIFFYNHKAYPTKNGGTALAVLRYFLSKTLFVLFIQLWAVDFKG